MIEFSKFKSLISLVNYFTTNEKCKQAIIESRWSKGEGQYIVRPYCGHHHCHRRMDRRFCCSHCKSNFSCLVGTIFENTKVSLQKQFMTMYLVSSHKKCVSPHQLSRDIQVCQKIAWFMLQKIRTLYVQDDSVAMKGDIELDEVYIGGKEKWKHKNMCPSKIQGRSAKTKTSVFDRMERTTIKNAKSEDELMTYVHAIVVSKTDGDTLIPIIKQFCEEGAHLITDELNSYNRLSSEGFSHDIVCHSSDEFVRGDIFTNDMECFWSHFSRMIIGCYHNIDVKYLLRYVDDACYRWNTLKDSENIRFEYMFKQSIDIVDYKNVKMQKAA